KKRLTRNIDQKEAKLKETNSPPAKIEIK
ncbi:MAG: hypothetical protein JWQ71_2372, partial [Pedosphaera sp.]|nr:hypothetical protein [Pedosphaera sp.]